MPIRNSAKALIVRGGHVLAIEHGDEHGTYYALPGGGQEPGETLAEAVVRECREELGADVAVTGLAFIRERVDEVPDHRVEFVFRCTLLTELDSERATRPDDGQRGLAWLPLAYLEQTRFYPLGLRAFLARSSDDGTRYLGHLR